VDRNGGGIREENVERANKLKTLVDTYYWELEILYIHAAYLTYCSLK